MRAQNLWLPTLQIASSLMYIHSKKVLHRDLKTQVSIIRACRVLPCFSRPESLLSSPWTGPLKDPRHALPFPHHSFQNIFIARGSIMKLGDFGIAKVLEKTDSFANTVTGTPYYMVRACGDVGEKR